MENWYLIQRKLCRLIETDNIFELKSRWIVLLAASIRLNQIQEQLSSPKAEDKRSLEMQKNMLNHCAYNAFDTEHPHPAFRAAMVERCFKQWDEDHPNE